MADVLTKEQLEAQLARREAFLAKCREEQADEKLICAVEKDIRMTKLRLERLKG